MGTVLAHWPGRKDPRNVRRAGRRLTAGLRTHGSTYWTALCRSAQTSLYARRRNFVHAGESRSDIVAAMKPAKSARKRRPDRSRDPDESRRALVDAAARLFNS